MEHPFRQRRERIITLREQRTKEQNVPRKKEQKPATFGKCPACDAPAPRGELAKNSYVCTACGHHYPVGAYLRLSMLLDPHSFRELDEKLLTPSSGDFPGYTDKLQAARKATGLGEAVVTAQGRIDGRPVALAVLDSRFFMGSMGYVVGEKVTRCIEFAEKSRCPLIIFSASGGARMQEGIISLMQMAKTSAAIARFSKAGGLYISCLTHPTTGGVSASFASLGDITLAEPGALIGFAGPRVIEQTIGQTLPEGFQRSEYLEEHGFVDAIVPRGKLRNALSQLLRIHGKRGDLHV